MPRVEGSLQIVLKSDLCSGSGDGFSSGIDQDVCYDESGLPAILGRRIKGCLREAAELARCEHVPEIFGVAKSSESGSLRVSNASITRSQQKVIEGEAQQTLSQYTTVRAMTAIDALTGSADSNTLRFSRVVRRYAPTSTGGGELMFEAPIHVDEAYKEEVERAASALRNMGMGRNRGFGAVRCGVVWGAKGDNGTCASGTGYQGTCFVDQGQKMRAISYVVTLDAPVMLPRDNAAHSADCIPGTSVLGFFASALAGSPRFDDLFLKGRLRFSPLYPFDEEHGQRCMPAPSFLVRVKGGARDGMLLKSSDFDPDKDEAAKPLRDGFVGAGWTSTELRTETVYHHSRQGEGVLYTQRCLSKGQKLAGFIECPDEEGLVEEVRDVLRRGRLAFGRSKSAQYATCSVQEASSDYAHRGDVVRLCAGERYALVLDSDMLLHDGAGYTTSLTSLREALVGALGQWFGEAVLDIDAPFADAPLSTNIRARTISGYNAKWNQKKPHVRAIAAGSTLVFSLPDDMSLDESEVPVVSSLGERQAEGFGRVVLICLSDVDVSEEGRAVVMTESCRQSPEEGARMSAVELADLSPWKSDKRITPSFIGRFSLMVRESMDERDLCSRIKSIKDAAKCTAADEAFKKVRAGVCASMPSYDWALLQECLTLYLSLIKYAKKQATDGEVS